MREIIEKTLSLMSDSSACILAVVAETWGSAPRQAGSLMVIGKDGTFEGSVSGGCVEGTVIAEALDLMGTGMHKSLSFSVSSDDAWQVGLACGGKIRIELFHLTSKDRPALSATLDSIDRRKSGTLTLSKISGEATFEQTAADFTLRELNETFAIGLEIAPRIFITGAVHIAQALAPMAISCGYDVTIIDPRGIFTDNRDFGGAHIVNDWPDDFLADRALDDQTAVVTLTHDPKIDDVALRAALNSDAFYIGALGSKKTHAARLSRFADVPGLDRIQGPVGLDIGARSPAEIAVSIIAQITLAKRLPNAF